MSEISMRTLKHVKTNVLQKTNVEWNKEKQVVVHFAFKCYPYDAFRIWETTYLKTEDGSHYGINNRGSFMIQTPYNTIHLDLFYQINKIKEENNE